MTNQSENKKNYTTEQEQTEQIRGRTHNSQNPEFEPTASQGDISAVDQQEGNMQHGETGGHNLSGDDPKTSR